MFGNAYQNGHIFEVWDSKVNPDKNQLYKQLFRMVPASTKKYFDKEVKSYIYSLEGQVSKMCMPASDQKELSLHQKYLVLHVYIPLGQAWSMELGITDITNTKRRINLTNTQGKQQVKYFSLRYPLSHLERGVWVFLGVNIYSFMQAFKDQVFRSLDHITVGSNCLIRRIFTMKEWSHFQIPKAYWFPGEISQQFQLIEYVPPSSLPKISMSKGSVISHNLSEPPVTSLYERLTPSKIQSKLGLGKSEVSPPIMSKSKNYGPKPMSLEPINKNQYSPDSKQIKGSKIKLRLNSMKDESHMSSLLKREKVSKLDENIFKKQKQIERINERERQKSRERQREKQREKEKQRQRKQSERQEQGNKNKIKKSSIARSPMLQKSFRQDEALAVAQESSQNFETSHQTIIHAKNFATLSKSQHIQQKWTSSDDQKTRNKILDSHTGQKKKQGRTQIVKENNEIKKNIISSQKKEEIELIYDEMVGCYYHPQTHMYYELKN